jgi:hypothetical protein
VSDELHHSASGASRGELVIGFMPRISIDLRIRCPHTFDEKNPPLPPPTLRYSEIASKACHQVMSAMWFCRGYIEVIKIGYAAGTKSSNDVYITGEIVLIVPVTGEKIVIRSEPVQIGNRFDHGVMDFALSGPEMEYYIIIDELVCDIVDKTRKAVQGRKEEINGRVVKLGEFQTVFETR